VINIKWKATSYLLILSVLITIFGFTRTIRADEDNYFKTLQGRLVADGFDQNNIKDLYNHAQVSFDVRGVSRFFRHTEAKLNYDQFTSRKSIRKARQYMDRHKTELLDAERNYGVDKEVITAIILVETRLGTGIGRSSVLNILSTMAALSDPEVKEFFWQKVSKSHNVKRDRYDRWVDRKTKWAYAELTAFLKYSYRENIDPVAVRGSYAGALGIAQFMPSSIIAYAKDGNTDGRVDLFTHADAIASVANYLKCHGWRPNSDKKAKHKVIWSYNRSDYYVNAIFKISKLLKESA